MNISEMSWKINLKKESSSSTESIDNFTLKANKKSDKLLVQLVFCFFLFFLKGFRQPAASPSCISCSLLRQFFMPKDRAGQDSLEQRTQGPTPTSTDFNYFPYNG